LKKILGVLFLNNVKLEEDIYTHQSHKLFFFFYKFENLVVSHDLNLKKVIKTNRIGLWSMQTAKWNWTPQGMSLKKKL